MKIFALFCVLFGSSLAATTVEKLAGDSRFTTLVSLVTQAKLVDILNGGSFTIFAPTNKAFNKLSNATLNAVTSNTTLLTSILTYHVVPGAVPSSAAKNEFSVITANGARARFNIYDHNNKTTVTIQGAHIVDFDRMASNGVIHVVNSVMMPPEGDIVSYVSQDQNLKTLFKLVQQAGIANNLMADGLTLFAPTDSAFALLAQDQLNAVQSDNALLTNILTYHVVKSTQYSPGMWNKEHLDTLTSGTQLTLRWKNHHTQLGINGLALTTMLNIGTTNGVIHLIDHVLMPPSNAGVVG